MDIGGTASDESSGKVIRPIYDGKIKSWPAFKIKAEAYIVRKGWSDIIIDGVVDTPDATPLYYLCRNDGEGYSDAMWTPRDIIDAVIDGRVEPTNHVLAKCGDTDWSQLTHLMPILRAEAMGSELKLGSPQQKLRYYDVIDMIDHKTKEGASLLQKVNDKFKNSKHAHNLWCFLHARWQSLAMDDDGEMATAQLKGIKFPYGIPPDEFTRLTTDFDHTYDKLPSGKQGVPGDKAKAWFRKLEKAPFEKWIAELVANDENRDEGTPSKLCDFDLVSKRLSRRYLKWYTSKGGNGEDDISKSNGQETKDPKVETPQEPKPAAKALAAATKQTSKTQTTNARNCYRCRKPGHITRDCPDSPQTCTSCHAHGAFLTCGGEYKADQCMVVHKVEESSMLTDKYREAIEAYRNLYESHIKEETEAEPTEKVSEAAAMIAGVTAGDDEAGYVTVGKGRGRASAATAKVTTPRPHHWRQYGRNNAFTALVEKAIEEDAESEGAHP